MSRNPSTVMTANGEVQTRKEATVYFEELDLLVTVMPLEETPAVLSLWKLCEDHGCNHHWTSGQKPHLTKNGRRINCKKSNYVRFLVHVTFTSFFNIFIAGFFDWHGKSSNRTKWEYECKLRRNPLQNPAETENTNKNKDDEELRGGMLRDLPECSCRVTEKPIA